ncbi:MAG: hypothetical protein HYZ73_07870, partial [Elusimicrobia bacterium]|nr:hypothetical protein [Elusimicrobiota bacterium]
ATQALGLDPFAGSLISRTLSGAISGAISPSHNIFQGVYNAFRDSVGNFSTIPPPPDPEDPRFIATLQNGTKVWDQAAYNQAIGQYEASRPVWMAQALAKTNNFSDEIRQYGLAQAVENYATSIFHRDSVESLVQSFGTIKDAITQRMQQNKIQNVTLEDGTQAKKLSLADDKDFALLYKEDPFGEISLLGLTEDEIDQRYYELRADRQTRTAGMTEGTITRTYRSTAPNGTTVTAQFLEEVSAAGVTKVTIQDSQGNSYTVTPNSFQDIRLNADGSIRNGLLTASSGAKFYFQNGILIKSRLVGRTDVETGEPLDPFRVSPTSSSDFVMEITEAISGQPRMITLEGNPPPEVAQILQNQPEFQRYLSDFLVPPAHAETVEPVVGIAEAFSDLNGYLKSQGFGTIRDTQGNTAAVDALYGRAAQLAGGDTRKTLEYFLAIVNIKDRKLDINDLEWERRVRNLPSGLVGTFKPLSESYDNRDKLQHFATSALLTYRTNRIFADFAGRAYEWHDWAQKFTTDYLDPTYTNNGGYSNEDVRANRLGQDFGTVVKQEGGTKPSYVLY